MPAGTDRRPVSGVRRAGVAGRADHRHRPARRGRPRPVPRPAGAGITAPVVFLTARDALPDRLSGFAAGGDDYLTKPFAFAELVARLRALLRRDAVPDAGDGRLRVDPIDHAAHCGGESVPLTPTEYRLLALLAARGGEVVRRAELVQAGWPHGAIVHDNTLDAYIARLRRKIRAMPGAPELATVHGVGYSLR